MLHAHAHRGLIGPNAVVQVANALRTACGEDLARAVFRRAQLERHLGAPPEEMVPEAEANLLQSALFDEVGEQRAREIAFDAGLRTGDYLLAHRIPKPAQAVLKALPSRLAGRILLKAIARHAWTFAGSGTFKFVPGHPIAVSIAHCPLCRDRHGVQPLCDYYAGTFEQLFRSLVHRRASVREVACEAVGGDTCRFEICWDKERQAGR